MTGDGQNVKEGMGKIDTDTKCRSLCVDLAKPGFLVIFDYYIEFLDVPLFDGEGFNILDD